MGVLIIYNIIMKYSGPENYKKPDETELKRGIIRSLYEQAKKEIALDPASFEFAQEFLKQFIDKIKKKFKSNNLPNTSDEEILVLTEEVREGEDRTKEKTKEDILRGAKEEQRKREWRTYYRGGEDEVEKLKDLGY